MSFTAQIKQEIAAIKPEHDCCPRAELAALARAIGTIEIGHQLGTLLLSSENPGLARRVFKLSKQIGWPATVSVRQYSRPRHYHLYVVQLPLRLNSLSLLQEIGLADRKGHLKEHIDSQLLERKCCRRAYLRGCFLGSGFVSRLGRAYHLEIVLHTVEAATELKNLLSVLGLNAGYRERQNTYLIYMKDADQIGVFLRLIGATQGVLAFENNRIVKEMRNRVNRLVNFETSNLSKSVQAAVEQVAMLKEIEARIGLAKLRPPLRTLAKLRLRYPEASLTELGKMLNPPVGKSGVNHRFRELRSIVVQIHGQDQN
jgi:DNA-binding protein WhiA